MVTNITLSADEALIRRAREVAAREKRSLNSAFREWLKRYTATGGAGDDYEQLMQELSYARAGRRFTRDEMNER